MSCSLGTITTERLILQPVEAGQAAAIVAGDLSVVPAGQGWPHADTLDALRLVAEHGGPAGWFVTLRSDGTVIGDCGWKGGPDADGVAEIGYGLAAPWHGLGYGTELVNGLVTWAATQPRCRRLVAQTLVGNVPSRRLLQRCGFSIDSHDGPWVWYSRWLDEGEVGHPMRA